MPEQKRETWWKVEYRWSVSIETHTVCRYTALSVWHISEFTWAGVTQSRVHRQLRESCGEKWFPMWEEARAFALEKAEEKVQAARRSLELANAYLGNVKGMKKPEVSNA